MRVASRVATHFWTENLFLKLKFFKVSYLLLAYLTSLCQGITQFNKFSLSFISRYQWYSLSKCKYGSKLLTIQQLSRILTLTILWFADITGDLKFN